MDRITSARVTRALESYVNALETFGHYVPQEGYRVVWGNPYGQVMYVYTIDASGSVRHDVPGFQGSGGSGAITKRELWDRITTAHRVVSELAYPQASVSP